MRKEFEKIKLENGLRVIVAPQPSSLAATILVMVEAGSEYETREINGLSHFLEHMCFKGTTNRPRPGMIANELDSLGAEYNAFTGQEYTGYWAKVQYRSVAPAIDLIADLYLNPLFPQEEINKERGVIIEEINLYEDTPTRKVHDLFTELLYKDQPAGWDIGGRKEVIRKLQREDFVKYRAAHYVPGKTVVVVAGNIDKQKVLRQIKSLFSGMPKKKKIAKFPTRESQRAPEVLVKYKDSDQSHLVLGFRAFDMFDKRKYAIQVLANVLGGGMSSRLFHRIREELGAAYYVRAASDLSVDHGFFAASAGVDHRKFDLVVTSILEECRKLAAQQVPAAEFKKTKDHLIGGIILGLESSDELASFYGGQETMTGKVASIKEVIDGINRVQPSEVQAVAKFLFDNRKLNMAVIGPYKNGTQVKKLLKI